MQKHVINSLFKPFVIHKKSFIDFLDAKTKRNYYKHKFWFECSKATDEKCANTKCKYNYLNLHQTELYIDLMQEIQAEKLEIKKRNGIKDGDVVCKNI